VLTIIIQYYVDSTGGNPLLPLCYARRLPLINLVPRPHPRRGKGPGDIWALSWFFIRYFCESQSKIAALPFFMWPYIWSRSNDCTMSAGSLALANKNAVLWFCIALRSNVGLARDWLHNIGMKLRTCTTKKLFQCHLPARGFGLGTRLPLDDLNVVLQCTYFVHVRILVSFHKSSSTSNHTWTASTGTVNCMYIHCTKSCSVHIIVHDQ
jgi:hypothetical protein